MKNPLKKLFKEEVTEAKKDVKNDAPRDIPVIDPDVPEKKQREHR